MSDRQEKNGAAAVPNDKMTRGEHQRYVLILGWGGGGQGIPIPGAAGCRFLCCALLVHVWVGISVDLSPEGGVIDRFSASAPCMDVSVFVYCTCSGGAGLSLAGFPSGLATVWVSCALLCLSQHQKSPPFPPMVCLWPRARHAARARCVRFAYAAPRRGFC